MTTTLQRVTDDSKSIKGVTSLVGQVVAGDGVEVEKANGNFTVSVDPDFITGSVFPVEINEGGTGQITQSAGFDALSPTTTRGDMIVRGASSNQRLAAGTSGYALLATGAGSEPAWTGFSQLGAGASVRSFLTKIREGYVSVTDFGAVGYELWKTGTDYVVGDKRFVSVGIAGAESAAVSGFYTCTVDHTSDQFATDVATKWTAFVREDNTAAFLAAVATKKNVYIPGGAFYVSDEIELLGGQKIFGDGETASIIYIDDDYNLSADGAPFKGEQFMANGPQLHDFGIVFYQPDTAVRANLIGYPPAVYLWSVQRAMIRDVRIDACRTAIFTNGGGHEFLGVKTSALDKMIDLNGALDTTRIDRCHHYSFGLTSNQLSIFVDDTTIGFEIGYADDVKISNSLTIGGRGIRCYVGNVNGNPLETAAGPTVSITNHRFDGYGGIYIEAGDINIAGGLLSLNTSDKRGIYHTGGTLLINRVKFLLAAVGATNNHPIVEVNHSTSTAVFTLKGCIFESSAVDCKHIYAYAQSGILGALFLIGNKHLRAPNTSYTKQTIHIAATPGQPHATIIGNQANDKGTGTGTFIVIDGDSHHYVIGNKSIGWTTTFPAAVLGFYEYAALTRTNDTNVTLTLGGTPTQALLAATSITVGWSGTLAAARLNSNVVQGVTSDTNVTGSISAQNLTLGWTGQLAPSRGGTGISALGTGVATALGVNVGSAGAFVTFNGALGSPSSVGTLPAHALGGTVSGGGNQINNVVIGNSNPLAGSFTTLVATTLNGATIDNTAWTSYTPTVTATSGTFTSATATGRWKQIGKVVFIKIHITITTFGTGVGPRATLPTAGGTGESTLSGREIATTGVAWTGTIASGGTLVVGQDYTNSGVVANGAQIVFTGTYEAA